MQNIIRNDPETEVALSIENFIGNGDSYKKLLQIQNIEQDVNIHYNYVLKCSDGMFKGKFLYINTTPDGELFGSGNPDELDLTMYIESASLSEKHAEIKFVENCKYILKDCNSETGTWIRIGHPGDSKEYIFSSGYKGSCQGDLDLYQESRLRLFKAGDYHFQIDEHPNKIFNEVYYWLKFNGFQQLIEIFEIRQIKSLQQLIQQINLDDLKQLGLSLNEIERFMYLISLLQKNTNINLQPLDSKQKKMLELRFFKGHLKEEFLLDPENMPIIFGKQESNSEAGQQFYKIEISGEKICTNHFEIDFDKVRGTISLRNLNLNPLQSCGLYKMLFANENHNLQPGDSFRIGTLEFQIERFNTGIICDIGQRDHMEDSYRYVQQLMNLDNKVQITYYAVFDGHGGSVCADFCSEYLHLELKQQLEDVITGIENSDDLNKSVQQCIVKAFQITDDKYEKAYPNQCKQCGSTAVVALFVGNKLFVANVGDARAILSRQGQAIDLSVDHKAKRQDEQHRIKSQGGYIVYGRVLGRLAISRAFGDFDCKKIETKIYEDGTQEPSCVEKKNENGQEKQFQKVIRNFIMSEPEIRVVDINPQQDDFILLASDGLFDRFTSQQCVKIVRQKLQKMEIMEQDAQQVVQELVNQAKSKRMMTDNITVILVLLNRGIHAQNVANNKNQQLENN